MALAATSESISINRAPAFEERLRLRGRLLWRAAASSSGEAICGIKWNFCQTSAFSPCLEFQKVLS